MARGTPGFSGAELSNLVNEAALIAVRDQRHAVTAADLDQARDRLMLGQRQDSSILRDEERSRVAVHESGHAVVGVLTPHSDPVTKVTILPSGRALGLTEQLPEAEKRLLTREEMEDQLAVMMGGRVAERLLTGQLSSGAANDLARATQLAVRMVSEFGMSDQLGPVGYGQPDQSALRRRPFAEDTQREVDAEVARVLREAEATAEKLLTAQRDALEALVDRLLEADTVDGGVVRELVDAGLTATRPSTWTAGSRWCSGAAGVAGRRRGDRVRGRPQRGGQGPPRRTRWAGRPRPLPAARLLGLRHTVGVVTQVQVLVHARSSRVS